MFPKITSKREPGVTLGSELRKEFSPYLLATTEKAKQALRDHPRFFFSLMVIAMLVSGLLAFTVLRKHETKKPLNRAAAPGGAGMGQLVRQAEALQQLWRLQGQVDELLQKQKPDHADSLLIGSALAQMDSLRKAVHEARRPLIQQHPQTVIP